MGQVGGYVMEVVGKLESGNERCLAGSSGPKPRARGSTPWGAETGVRDGDERMGRDDSLTHCSWGGRERKGYVNGPWHRAADRWWRRPEHRVVGLWVGLGGWRLAG